MKFTQLNSKSGIEGIKIGDIVGRNINDDVIKLKRGP